MPDTKEISPERISKKEKEKEKNRPRSPSRSKSRSRSRSPSHSRPRRRQRSRSRLETLSLCSKAFCHLSQLASGAMLWCCQGKLEPRLKLFKEIPRSPPHPHISLSWLKCLLPCDILCNSECVIWQSCLLGPMFAWKGAMSWPLSDGSCHGPSQNGLGSYNGKTASTLLLLGAAFRSYALTSLRLQVL